jgi:hypothetical protein
MFRLSFARRAALCAAAVATLLSDRPVEAQTAANQPEAASRPARAPIDYGTARLDRQLDIVRATGRITLDGALDEPAWADAPMAHGFIQNDPREGEPATYDTEVRMLYDDDALYFGVFAKDDEPGRIVVNDLKKDFNTGSSDGFRVILDTFHDARNAYEFATNPAGAKWDAQMTNEGQENNANWDGIWDVETKIAETGWYAEIRIPFRTLKFNPSEVQTWGVNFERKLRRLNEDSFWSPLPRIYDLERVSLAGTVDGLRGLRPGKNLRLKPYASSASSAVAGRRTDGDLDAGFDVKYGVTSGLVWDFTVNTDFSQAEADEQQINLTRLNVLFPEKRDFFLENSGIFTFGGGGRNNNGNNGGGQNANAQFAANLFFSRRIGLSENGEPIPIVGGTRLSGRQGAYSIGVLNMQQREFGATPATNFATVRVRRDVLANSSIGAIVLNKEEAGAGFNRVAGVDGNFRFGDLLLTGWAAKSFSPAIAAPDPGNEYASNIGATFVTRQWSLQSDFKSVGGAFNDEMGFIQRNGVSNWDGRFGPTLRPAILSKWVRQTVPHVELDVFFRHSDWNVESRYINYHWNANFQDGSNMEVGYNTSAEDIGLPFTINSNRGVRVQPGHYHFGEYFGFWNTNPAARVSFNNRVGMGKFYDGYRRNYAFGPSVRLNENFNASFNLQINDISLSAGEFTTKLLSTRLNYNFNTKMFANALVQYNTDNRQWTSNLRFNIIHRPLSDFFLVYNEKRDDRTGLMLSRAVIAKMTYMVAF